MKAGNAKYLVYVSSIVLLWTSSCKNKPAEQQSTTTGQEEVKKIKVPDFNADTAYKYVEQQVSYGPRVPGTKAQQACAAWMEAELKKACDTVYRQSTTVKGGDGKTLPCINLIGCIHPKAEKRILLLTHWDSRPWADMDTKDKDKPILAADDAGSGVAVLIELADALKANKLPDTLGIDILLTDVEDYGKDNWGENSYCLGTQYWAHNPHVQGYTATFGILLDMVGARNAQFPMEGFSTQYANNVQQQIWQAASTAGYSSYFPFVQGATIIDDHIFVNRIAHIPTVDIINLSTNNQSAFAAHWHTHQDNMDIIDKNTLKAVGQTLLQVIYENAQ